MILLLPKDIIIMYCINLLLYRHMELPPVQNQHLKELPRNEKAASMTQVPWNKNYRRSPFWLGRSSINGHQWPQFSVPGTNQRRSEDWNTTNLCSLQTHIHIYEHIYIYIHTHALKYLEYIHTAFIYICTHRLIYRPWFA